MTATADRERSTDRPRPAKERRATDVGPPSLRLELAETPDGWVLTVAADPDTAAALSVIEALVAADPQCRPEISVRPNLVPGEPIPLTAVRVVVDNGRDIPRSQTKGN